jgi:uncharacterized protein (DUF362 family)
MVLIFISNLIFTEAASEKAGQLYTLKASLQQETPPKSTLSTKPKAVCAIFFAGVMDCKIKVN